ncbi:hypothetical protein POSPLADRAFT_1050287 [Postia placenta MAD-698-R-SB12]|uniref:Uncharacterized protein n=1 Tax=Postia placenta MAD-698-R-SB12 TaxID=670580 RepID=A0A1X6MLW6_9APHY|nr:hypothetical protein POSPLADRAFT_1050287 [Postia placenta MAD-698-R-SB12]OSX57269.1 hypothetical protein POSPLADRAFT_1050287 [Postia placenta MAD-698-R-SB12]
MPQRRCNDQISNNVELSDSLPVLLLHAKARPFSFCLDTLHGTNNIIVKMIQPMRLSLGRRSATLITGNIGCDKNFKLAGGLEKQKDFVASWRRRAEQPKVDIYPINLKENMAPMNKIHAERERTARCGDLSYLLRSVLVSMPAELPLYDPQRRHQRSYKYFSRPSHYSFGASIASPFKPADSHLRVYSWISTFLRLRQGTPPDVSNIAPPSAATRCAHSKGARVSLSIANPTVPHRATIAGARIANMMAAVQDARSNKEYITKLTMYLTRKDNHLDMMMSISVQFFRKPEDVSPWTCLGVLSSSASASCWANSSHPPLRAESL